MSDEPKDPAKKLIIDEDWKSQVEAEKAAAEKGKEAQKPAEPEPSPGPGGPLPPADFTFLVSSLYLQGALSLALIPNPMTGKAEVDLDHARHIIDTLAMLQQKTEGNRTPDESAGLDAALHELRMTFVTVGGGPTE
jgi:hypothetical protein